VPDPPLETLRLHQSNERTLLAWVRTGIAIMAFGFAIARFGVFLRQVAALGGAVHVAPGAGSAWIGTMLVGLGTLTNAAATVRYMHVRRGIERGDLGAPNVAFVIGLGATATLIGVAMALLLARSIAE
jgi:putative membrane protein